MLAIGVSVISTRNWTI